MAAQAQTGIPLFDPEWQLVPEAHELDPSCPEGYPLGFGGFLQLIQNAMNAAISFGIVIFVLIIAFAGILWILTPTNPENHSQAKKVLTNAVIGLLIVLSAWLIVDFVMKTLYGGQFGPWNSILLAGEGAACIEARENPALFSGAIIAIPPTEVSDTTGGGGSCSPIPDSQLVTFDPSATDGQVRRGTADTVERFMRMRAAAQEAGITLKAGSTYRSPEEGEALWRSRGCRIVNGRTVCNGATVAVPCSLGGSGSNHTRGTAIDIQTNSAGVAWMRQNASRFGFYNAIASEPWHWSSTGR